MELYICFMFRGLPKVKISYRQIEFYGSIVVKCPTNKYIYFKDQKKMNNALYVYTAKKKK